MAIQSITESLRGKYQPCQTRRLTHTVSLGSEPMGLKAETTKITAIIDGCSHQTASVNSSTGKSDFVKATVSY